jgi:hypothetical protein
MEDFHGVAQMCEQRVGDPWLETEYAVQSAQTVFFFIVYHVGKVKRKPASRKAWKPVFD